MDPIGGLICRLALPADPLAMNWQAMMERLAPHVDGILLDFSFWQPDPGAEAKRSEQEYLEILLPHLPTGRPLLIQVAGSTREQTLHHIEQWESFFGNRSRPAALVWVDLPLRYHSNRGLPELYREFQKRTANPILLENDPSRVKRFKGLGQRSNIRTHILKTLIESAPVLGLIHHGDLKRALHYSRAAAGHRHFKVLDGSELHFLDYPSTSGLVSITANLVPSAWASMISGTRANRNRTDHQAQYDALHNLKNLTGNFGERPANAILYLLFLAGLLQSPPPLDQAATGQLKRLWQHLTQAEQSCTVN